MAVNHNGINTVRNGKADWQPTGDRREQIRRALAEADGFAYEGLEPHDYQRHADALLALLPPVSSSGRAALLHETADRSAIKAEAYHDCADEIEAREDCCEAAARRLSALTLPAV